MDFILLMWVKRRFIRAIFQKKKKKNPEKIILKYFKELFKTENSEKKLKMFIHFFLKLNP